jgi:hypothetical protein
MHRRTSGSKVRSHKIGIGNGRFQSHKQARLSARRALVAWEQGKTSE